jgi:hypothetical protein
MAAFQRWLERELKATGDKLYAVEGEELLVPGKEDLGDKV